MVGAQSEDPVDQYWLECERLARERPGSVARADLERFLPQWLMSLGRDSLAQARPWITFAAEEALTGLVRSDARIFEWGAGGSTLFLGNRVSELVTVEHDQHWLRRTATLLPSRTSFRWRAYWLEPVARAEPCEFPATDPEAYASTDARYAQMSFENYAKAIERYPNNYFDIVLIDGRARPSCFKHAVAKVKLGGHIVVDNMERDAYAWIRAAAERLNFDTREYWGPGPYNSYFWCTSIFCKTQDRFALNDLDIKIEPFLRHRGGIFVEAGANDGVRQSNTFYWESRHAWRGLLIEPIYERALECRRFRPHAKVVCVALVEPEKAGTATVLRYVDLMSVVRGGMRSAEEEDRHVEAGCAVQKIESREFSVPTASLSGVLDEYGITHIDLLSLDVEGYEGRALRGLDMRRHRPRFILVEARYRDEVDAVLRENYEMVAQLSHHDLLYRLKNDPGPRTAQSDADVEQASAAAVVCRVCASAMAADLDGMFDDRYGYPGYFSLYRCPHCRQRQTVPLLEDGDLPQLYGTYYPRREIDLEALVQQIGDPWSPEAKRRRWLSGTDNQGQYLAQPGAVVLDYGCGAGQSLLELEKLGAIAYGIEADPNVRQVAEALKLRIHVGSIDDEPFPGVQFDLIVLNQVLEHLPDPEQTFAKLARRLKPNGRVVLSFPNSSSLYCRVFGRAWINWHIPYHLHHFNPHSARLFVRRCGFRVASLRTITPNLWTVLQLRALQERTRMGVPNRLWTGQEATASNDESHSPFVGLVSSLLHRLALQANKRWARAALSFFNRVVDATGAGDSILVVVEREERQ